MSRQGAATQHAGAHAGAPSGSAEIASPDRLLRALRRHTGNAGLRFDAPPERAPGGFETRVFRLRLAGGSGDGHGLHGPLVLRVFDRGAPPRQASWEAAVHAGLLEQGFPVPRILIAQDEPSDLGEGFVVMEEKPGVGLLAWLEAPASEAATQRNRRALVAAIPRVAHMLSQTLPTSTARMQRRLARVDPEGILAALEGAGFPPLCIGFERHLDRLDARCEACGLDGFAGVRAWLRRSRPTSHERPMIAHGDMPPNILFDGDHATSVIDWSPNLVTLCHPEYEVGNTLVLLGLRIPLPRPLRVVAETLQRAAIRRYLGEVQQTLRLSTQAVDYYQAFRCAVSLVGVAELRLSELGAFDGPVRDSPWSDPTTTRDLIECLGRLTGIRVTLPPVAHASSRHAFSSSTPRAPLGTP